jgi:hypothetical protein
MANYTLGAALNAAAGHISAPRFWQVSSGYPTRAQWISVAPDHIATSAVAITPDDTTVYIPPLAWLWVATQGTVAVRMLNGMSASFASVPAGTELRVCCTQVYASTTSTVVGCR